ncbi:MAG: GntR family transcriptional regulator [Caldilineaceae bacterium]|nr:GntR family transcriptional regulator [Caldilineaceae bacterium]
MKDSADGQERIPVDSFDRSETSRSEHAYEWLHQRIFSGDIPPGTVLREVQLAQEAGVSRTPIRDGLLRLAEIGLVKRYANRGTVVVEMRFSSNGAPTAPTVSLCSANSSPI